MDTMNRIYRNFVYIFLTVSFFLFIHFQLLRLNQQSAYYLQKELHMPAFVSDEYIRNLTKLINLDDFRSILEPVLVERVVGTPQHETVKSYIIDKLKSFNWQIELDSFTQRVINKGNLTFTNIIATYDNNAPRHLVLACHYDSKDVRFPFVAATDSAVPCAMLLYLAKILNNTLAASNNRDVSLKLVFFDGEEAFVSWTETDSLYGSRHLATQMDRDSYIRNGIVLSNQLQRIDLMVLLDLLGAANPSFYNYFENTERWYGLMTQIERKLANLKLLKYESSRNQRYFKNQNFFGASISDDHEPFMHKGVLILHLIPYPFPREWHTTNDNKDVINWKTTKNLLMIVEVFVVQYIFGDSVKQ